MRELDKPRKENIMNTAVGAKFRVGILLSGGMDSTVALAMLVADSDIDTVPVFIEYGQVALGAEIRAVSSIVSHFGIGSFINLHIAAPGDSRILRRTPDRTDVYVPPGSPSAGTYVPHRNLIQLAYASAWGLPRGIFTWRVGWQQGDPGGGYPDTSLEFAEKAAEVLSMSAGTKIRVDTPLAGSSKADIVRIGRILKVPFELTYSCYYGFREHCGECPSCKVRIAGFKEVGVIDPVKYRTEVDWSGCAPWPGEGR
jgi:7-cyano-7-deazaguanine synthase